MKRWSWLLLAALVVAPAIADDKKKKDDKKAKDAPVVQAPVAQDAVKDAEAKLAAGDADGAIAALEKAMGADPKAALRLGQVFLHPGLDDCTADFFTAGLGGQHLGKLGLHRSPHPFRHGGNHFIKCFLSIG